MKIISFIKNWSLPISMLAGVIAYFTYVSIHALDFTHTFVSNAISNFIQPALIFCMLFVSFCKISPKQLKPQAWMAMPLLIQILSFAGIGGIIALYPGISARVILESIMICMICPTATAASVITSRLHGNASAVVSYTCIINLAVSLTVPAIVPLIRESGAAITFLEAFLIILRKIFPTLIFPLLLAFASEVAAPKLHTKVKSQKNLAFNLWIVALALAIAVTTRAIVHTEESAMSLLGIAIASLFCCIIQFAIGRLIGIHNREIIASTQALGQKNTVFAIWMGATFMDPITATAGGFYSVWHNIVNSYQLYRERKKH